MFNNYDPTRAVKAEWHPGSPRIRLSLVSYALENGYPIDGLTEQLDELLEFITDGYDEFVETLDELYPPDDDDDEDKGDVQADPMSEDVDDPFPDGTYL